MKEILSGKTPNERLTLVIQLAIMISLIEMIAQCSLKYCNHSKGTTKKVSLILGIIFYVFVGLMLLYTYSYEGMGHMNLCWSCVSIIVASIAGFLFFNENFNRYTCISIFFALIAIVFAHFADEV